VSVATLRFQDVGDAVAEIRRLIDGATEIGCLAHKDADADSLGSALAFAAALRDMGKRVHPVVPSPLPVALGYLPGFAGIVTEPPPLDLLFTFDCATLNRFGDRAALVESVAHVVNVDHHPSNDGFGEINLVDPAASATGQVVYRLLRALGCPISAATATNLYAALLTDTGSFRHENTTEAALRLGADLVGLGANAGWVALKSYKSRTLAQLRLEGLAVAGARTEQAGRLVWSEITTAMLEETGATMQEAEGVIDQLQTVDAMKVAILFKQAGPRLTKISVRSRDEIDAADICVPFHGGGHRRAAGAELGEPLETARERVLEVARARLRQIT
jgi:phosphoesterase RecJ-like protein